MVIIDYYEIGHRCGKNEKETFQKFVKTVLQTYR